MKGVAYLAAHREKRAGKDECFSVIRRMANGHSVSDQEVAALYSYFLPPKMKKVTNGFQWAALACNQKENYSFCKYVESDGQKLIGANTRQANLFFSSQGLEPGFYDIGGGYAGDDVAIMPNVQEVLAQSEKEHMPSLNIDSLEVLDTPAGLAYVLPWNEKGIPKDMLDAAMRNLDGVKSISYDPDGPFKVSGFIRGVPACSVMMPSPVVGLRRSNPITNIEKSTDSQKDMFIGA